MDSKESCLDRQHFENYPHFVEYSFNSRGFRDAEWPADLDELSDCVWCLGDSFTVGIGSPLEHTWPFLLSKKIQQRTINVSMDGASNQWIARRANQILSEIRPGRMVIMWSYMHRREHHDCSLSDEQRRLHNVRSSAQQDWDVFLDSVKRIRPGSARIVNLAIPFYTSDQQNSLYMEKTWQDIRGPDWPEQLPRSVAGYASLPDFIRNEIKSHYHLESIFQHYLARRDEIGQLIEIPHLDKARDGHHFDVITATWVADQIAAQWQQ